jgi:hypothetical protein
MLDVRLAHPLQAEGLHQLHDALEARAYVRSLTIKLGP